MTSTSLLCAAAAFSLVAMLIALLLRGRTQESGRRRIATLLWWIAGAYTLVVLGAAGVQGWAGVRDGSWSRMPLTEQLIAALMWVMMLIGVVLPLIEVATHLRHGGRRR